MEAAKPVRAGDDLTLMCSACNRSLVPLSYPIAVAATIADRPDVKCPLCGRAYRLGSYVELFPLPPA